MKYSTWSVAVVLLIATGAVPAQDVKAPPGTPVTITVTQAQPSTPPVSITLGSRHGHVNPTRCGCTHTGGGNIDIQQPSADTVVITMTGVAVAYAAPMKDSLASLHFDLEQCFEVAFDNPKVKKAKLTLEGRVIGLLRSHKGKGAAEQGAGCAGISSNGTAILLLTVPPHSVSCDDNQSINCREGAVSIPITAAGPFTLHQKWSITASHQAGLLPCKAPSAEFAPDPALDPLWISYKEPFKGASKKDFGFQITLKVVDDTGEEPKKEEEKKTEDKKEARKGS